MGLGRVCRFMTWEEARETMAASTVLKDVHGERFVEGYT